MTEIEGRLHQLEARMQRQEQNFHAYEQSTGPIGDMTVPVDHSPALPLPDRNTNLRSAGVQELLPEEASTDGMAITYADEEDSGYFGPSHLSGASW